MVRLKSFFYEINSKLWMIVWFYIILLVAWTIFYWFLGHRYYEAGVVGLGPDLFRAIGGNLAFFGIFGLATLIPTFTRPKDEPIDRRLGFLITSDHVSEDASNFIRREIVRLCGYIERSTVEIIVKEHDPASGALKIEYRSHALFRNTFESEKYVDDDFILLVHPDNVETAAVLGEITLAEFISGGAPEAIVRTPLSLTKPEPMLIRTTVRIARDSVTTYRLHNWIWYQAQAPYYVRASRFTESLVISIQNATECDLLIRDVAGTGEDFSLLPGGERELFRGHTKPGMMNVFQVLAINGVPTVTPALSPPS